MPYVGYTELDISVAGISFQNMALRERFTVRCH